MDGQERLSEFARALADAKSLRSVLSDEAYQRLALVEYEVLAAMGEPERRTLSWKDRDEEQLRREMAASENLPEYAHSEVACDDEPMVRDEPSAEPPCEVRPMQEVAVLCARCKAEEDVQDAWRCDTHDEPLCAECVKAHAPPRSEGSGREGAPAPSGA